MRIQKTPFGSHPFKRAVAIITVALFLSSSIFNYVPVAFAQPQSQSQFQSVQVRGGNPSGDLLRLDRDREIRIPPEFGKIDEIYRVERGTGNVERESESVSRSPFSVPRHDRMVVFIQDAHDSFEAQENIAKIIDHLVANYGVKTVFEEGYEGPVPTDKYFGDIQDLAIREKVARFFMDHLRIGGAEYAHINRSALPPSRETENGERLTLRSTLPVARSPHSDWDLIGADSLKLHKENVGQYRLSAAKKDAITQDLKALDREFKTLAGARFPREFKEWLRAKEQFDAKKLDMFTYLGRTMPLLQLSEEGKLQNDRKAEGEGRMEQAVNRHPPSTILHPAEDMTPLLRFILEAIQTNDPAVIEKAKHIDAREVFAELIKLEQAMAETYLEGASDQQLFEYYKILSLLKRLNDLQVSQEEYEALRASLELGVQRSSPNSELFNTQGMAEFIHKHTNKTLILSRMWEQNIQEAVKFYEIAAARDGAISQAFDEFLAAGNVERGTGNANKTKGLKEEKEALTVSHSPSYAPAPAVLVFGGFHKENIKRILEAKNISYLVVSPCITKPSPRHEEFYKKLMTDGALPFEKKIASGLATAARNPTLYNGMPDAIARAQVQTVYDALLANPQADLGTLDRMLGKQNRSEVREETESAKRPEIEDGTSSVSKEARKIFEQRAALTGWINRYWERIVAMLGIAGYALPLFLLSRLLTLQADMSEAGMMLPILAVSLCAGAMSGIAGYWGCVFRSQKYPLYFLEATPRIVHPEREQNLERLKALMPEASDLGMAYDMMLSDALARLQNKKLPNGFSVRLTILPQENGFFHELFPRMARHTAAAEIRFDHSQIVFKNKDKKKEAFPVAIRNGDYSLVKALVDQGGQTVERNIEELVLEKTGVRLDRSFEEILGLLETSGRVVTLGTTGETIVLHSDLDEVDVTINDRGALLSASVDTIGGLDSRRSEKLFKRYGKYILGYHSHPFNRGISSRDIAVLQESSEAFGRSIPEIIWSRNGPTQLEGRVYIPVRKIEIVRIDQAPQRVRTFLTHATQALWLASGIGFLAGFIFARWIPWKEGMDFSTMVTMKILIGFLGACSAAMVTILTGMNLRRQHPLPESFFDVSTKPDAILKVTLPVELSLSPTGRRPGGEVQSRSEVRGGDPQNRPWSSVGSMLRNYSLLFLVNMKSVSSGSFFLGLKGFVDSAVLSWKRRDLIREVKKLAGVSGSEEVFFIKLADARREALHYTKDGARIIAINDKAYEQLTSGEKLIFLVDWISHERAHEERRIEGAEKKFTLLDEYETHIEALPALFKLRETLQDLRANGDVRLKGKIIWDAADPDLLDQKIKDREKFIHALKILLAHQDHAKTQVISVFPEEHFEKLYPVTSNGVKDPLMRVVLQNFKKEMLYIFEMDLSKNAVTFLYAMINERQLNGNARVISSSRSDPPAKRDGSPTSGSLANVSGKARAEVRGKKAEGEAKPVSAMAEVEQRLVKEYKFRSQQPFSYRVEQGIYFDGAIEDHEKRAAKARRWGRRDKTINTLSGEEGLFIRLGEYAIADASLKEIIPQALHSRVVFLTRIEDQFRDVGHGFDYTMPYLAQIYQARNVFQNENVLEFGIGRGIAALLAIKLGAKRVVGIEKDPAVREELQKEMALNGITDEQIIFVEGGFGDKDMADQLKAYGLFKMGMGNIGPHFIYDIYNEASEDEFGLWTGLGQDGSNLKALELFYQLQQDGALTDSFHYIGSGFSEELWGGKNVGHYGPGGEIQYLNNHFAITGVHTAIFRKSLAAVSKLILFHSYHMELSARKGSPGKEPYRGYFGNIDRWDFPFGRSEVRATKPQSGGRPPEDGSVRRSVVEKVDGEKTVSAARLLAKRADSQTASSILHPISSAQSAAARHPLSGISYQKILQLQQDVIMVVERATIDALSPEMHRELLELVGVNNAKLHLVIPDALEGEYSDRITELKSVGRVYYGFSEKMLPASVPVVGFSDMEKDTREAFLKRSGLRWAVRIKDSVFGINQRGAFGIGILYALKDILPEGLSLNPNGFRYDATGRYTAQILEILKAYVVIAKSA